MTAISSEALLRTSDESANASIDTSIPSAQQRLLARLLSSYTDSDSADEISTPNTSALRRYRDNVSSMAERAWKTRFLGRESELQTLQAAFESARSGEMATVIVGGEAGVGKTRLVRRFLDEDKGATGTVLVGACRDYGEAPLPFGAIVEALRPLAKYLDDTTRTELYEPVQDELLKLLPGLESFVDSAPRDALPGSRSQLFEMVLSLLEAIASRGPLVLVIEDLHWADQSTLDLVSFLVTATSNARVAILITYRSDELESGNAFLRYVAQLARHDGVIRLNISRLEKDDLLTHLDDLAGSAIESSVGEQIWRRSQGNPFYAEELLASVGDGNGDQLPINVADVLISRIKLLSLPAQRLVRVLAAGGVTIEHSLLTKVLADMPDDEADASLREAISHQILVPDGGGFAFRHGLLREVAYSELLPVERREIHARFARALRDDSAGARSADIARHCFEAGEFAAALSASLDAAADAELKSGFAESHVHYERVLMLWPDVEEVERPSGTDLVELMGQCAYVSHLEGDNARSVALIRTALADLPDIDPRRRLLRVRLGAYLGALGESREALTEHEAVVREMNGEPPSSTHAEILCEFAQSLMAAARHRESVRHSDAALRMARAVGDRIHECRALTILGSNLVVLGEPDTGATHLQDALVLAEELGKPSEIAAGYRHLATTLSGPLNRPNEALAVARKGADRVAEMGLERHWGVSLQSIAIDTLFRMGRWDEAVATLSEAIHRTAKGAAALDLLLARAKLTVGRGEFESAERDLDRAATLAARAIDLRYTVPLATLRAGLALWQGEVDTARAAIASGLAHVGNTDDVWFAAPLVWHGMRAEADRADRARAAFDNKTVEEAIRCGEEFGDLSEQMCRSGRQQGALRLVVDAYDVMCKGELLRVKGEAAPEVWSVVAEAWDEVGQPYPSAYARWRLAEALLARPTSARQAATVLREAHATAVRLGAGPLRAEIESLSQRARIDLNGLLGNTLEEPVIDLRATALEQVASEANLTKREAQVLGLVAEGQSNRGIADVCFISEKTASVHVSNILTKLGVHSRTQAAALLHVRASSPSSS